MNRIYSILVRGDYKNSTHYQRNVDTTVGYSGLDAVADRLVPEGTDNSFYNYQAEQLVQICRKSRLKATLSTIDPLNTYEHTFGVITPSTFIGALPTGVFIDLLEPDVRHAWAQQSLAITFNPGGVITVNGLPTEFTVTDNITSVVPLADGLSMKMRGTLPGSNFSTIITVGRQPLRDLPTLITSLKTLETVWLARYREYQHSLDVNDWLAAYILNYCEIVDGS